MKILLPMYLVSPWSRNVALELAEMGHEVHVFDFNLPENEFIGYFGGSLQRPDLQRLASNVKLHQIETSINSKMRYFVYWRAFRKLCEDLKIDLVLALSAGGYAALTYYSGFRPYVVYTTGSDVILANRITRIINRRILKRAAAIFANGSYLADRTKELAQRHDVDLHYLGVNTERFSPSDNAKNGVAIISTRGFLPLYNNEFLIEALAHWPEEISFDKVIFCSSGPRLNDVKNLADGLLSPSLRAKVQFLGGVSDEELLDHLQGASIFVSLSRSDGTSISLLEALACSLFPVISDITQNREWIDPQVQNGLLVPLDDPAALAAALQLAIVNEPLRRQAGLINRKLVLDRADFHKNMGLLARKLEDVVEKFHQT